VDALFGGYQVAFIGNIISQSFQVNAANWGPSSNIELYKNKMPITDCRSGVCRDGYLWFNGYFAPNLVNQPNGVMGLPADYVPYQTPINNTPGARNFGNNNGDRSELIEHGFHGSDGSSEDCSPVAVHSTITLS
jgi:hypothetical protein